jgi:hypothetical protein
MTVDKGVQGVNSNNVSTRYDLDGDIVNSYGSIA